jgi:2-methylcitrate dehydratase PrpD
MTINEPLSTTLGAWASTIRFDDLPDDVVEATKLRILDIVGLALAGAGTPFGRATRAAAVAMSPPGPCRVFGSGEPVGVTTAAFTNGSCAQALEYDDTHNESIVHMSSPAVAASLAIAEIAPVSGRDLVAAIAVGNEISCRVGSVAPGQFHRRGFHPTGLFAPFGVTYLAGRLLGLDAAQMARAAGICGSFASGILECWVDGTHPKFLHPGWAAQSGIAAAFLGREGMTGPAQVFEGRFGLFASHLQDPAAALDFSRVTGGLGAKWDSRNSSLKPFPAAHVIHPYLDALLRLRATAGFTSADVERIDCPVAAFIVPIVCEPTAEKFAPSSDSHGRVSLQYSLAEALHLGALGKNAYAPESLANPEILALARRVQYHVDPGFPGPGRFKGAVQVTLKDGRSFTEVEEYNRGSSENPMTYREIRDKFDENASGFLSQVARDRLADQIGDVENLPSASALVSLTIAAGAK